MKLNRDYHIHTKLCKHARGEMHEYVESAIVKGLKEIAFTDHIPLPDGFDSAHRMDFSQLEYYRETIAGLQKTYPEIKIKCGIEADYYEGFEAYLEKTIRTFDFFPVILSVHFIRGWPERNWVFSYHFPDKPIRQIYAEYLTAVQKGIHTGLFDIVGHLDLIKSPDEPLVKHNRDRVISVLREVRHFRMAVEINTSGLRKQIEEMYPAREIVNELARLKIPLTIGSDAHQPDQVGFAFDQAADLLTKLNICEAGFVYDSRIGRWLLE